MGREFYSIDEAANLLGRSKRSIHYYIKQGLLTKKMKDGKVCIPANDVEQLAIDIGANSAPINRRTLIELQYKIRKLEEAVSVFKRILDVRSMPLIPSNEEAVSLFGASIVELTERNFSEESVQRWSHIYPRLDELSLSTICKAVGRNDAWEPIFRLCMSHLEWVSKQKDFKSNLKWQTLYENLQEGRKALKSTIVVWIELAKESTFVSSIETTEEGVLKRLSGSSNS